MLAKADTQKRIETAKEAVSSVKEIEQLKSSPKSALQTSLDDAQFSSIINAETAQLSDLKNADENFKNSMVLLISELDDETNSMHESLQRLQKTDTMERFVGFFSKTKADQMREKRIAGQDMTQSLNEVIKRSHIIGDILEEQLAQITDRLNISKENLRETVQVRKDTKDELKTVKEQLAEKNVEIENLNTEIDITDDVTEKAELEIQLTKLSEDHQTLLNQQKLLIARDQNFDRLFAHYKAYVDSLGAMEANQIVMLDVMKEDVKHRVTMTQTYVEAVKTNDQQAIAHQLNQLGKHVDIGMHESMNAMKTVSDNAFADMTERHSKHMDRLAQTDAQSARATAQFKERFAQIIAQQDQA